MKAGDVVLAMLSPGEPERHFWVIILAILDDNTAILGNITSSCQDHTLAIYDAEYEELTKRKSYLNYPAARIESLQSLEEKIRLKQIKLLKPVSNDLLRQIQEGLLSSKHTPKHIKEVFRKHNK